MHAVCHIFGHLDLAELAINQVFGLVACASVCLFQLVKIACNRRQLARTDWQTDFCHLAMSLAMVLMFLSPSLLPVLPAVFLFVALAIWFGFRRQFQKILKLQPAVSAQSTTLADALHAVMCAGMAYMYLSWQPLILTALFVGFLAAYGVLYTGLFWQNWKQRRSLPAASLILGGNIAHVLMAAAMALMFLFPMPMNMNDMPGTPGMHCRASFKSAFTTTPTKAFSSAQTVSPASKSKKSKDEEPS